MSIDVSRTIFGLDLLGHRVDAATERIVAQVAHTYQAAAMVNAPVGEIGNTTNEPGDLRRSIDVEGPTGGDGGYFARVGPTVETANPGPGGHIYNYGRLREFGGLIWAKSTLYMSFWTHGVFVQKILVYQEGAHYLLRARGTPIDGIIDDELTVAIEGG